MDTKNCLVCNAEIVRTIQNDLQWSQKYACSKKCRNINRKQPIEVKKEKVKDIKEAISEYKTNIEILQKALYERIMRGALW